MPIQIEHLVLDFHFPHTKDRFLTRHHSILCFHLHFQSIELRMELVPQQHILTHLQSDVTRHHLRIVQHKFHGFACHHMLFVRIECRSLQGDGHLLMRFAIKHFQVYACRFCIDIGIHPHFVYRIKGTQFYLSHDAIPITLRLVCHGMRVLPHLHGFRVIIHTDGNGVLSWFQ